MIKCIKCDWTTIENDVRNYLEKNNITIDSFWEDHVLASNHYQFVCDDEPVGFFAIHNQSMITLFHVNEYHADQGQLLFAKIKQFEQVTNAFVATGDEFFMSHCLDSFARIEKQAYFSIYTDKPLKSAYEHDLTLREAKSVEDTELFALTTDFFNDGSVERVLEGDEYFKIYLVEEHGQLVGFGVVEYSRIVPTIGSIGMYVLEDKRQQGYAACILKNLQHVVEGKGRRVHSGCWYYNHNSKKSMESAGAYSKTRLIRFYF